MVPGAGSGQQQRWIDRRNEEAESSVSKRMREREESRVAVVSGLRNWVNNSDIGESKGGAQQKAGLGGKWVQN